MDVTKSSPDFGDLICSAFSGLKIWVLFPEFSGSQSLPEFSRNGTQPEWTGELSTPALISQYSLCDAGVHFGSAKRSLHVGLFIFFSARQ